MLSFKQRSYQKEILDQTDIPFEEIRQNMQELDVINQYLGGHKITLEALKNLLPHCDSKDPIRVTEIGCGGGDNLRAIKLWCQHHKRQFVLTGIDINPECVEYAKSQSDNSGIQFICSDYKDVVFNDRPHILFTSLFCHHFTDDELIIMLQWMQQHSTTGFFINDLHRHPLAFYSIKALTQAFSKSRLVKNDAPLSVQRGFIKEDWKRLMAAAGLHTFKCEWKWAFRWLITYTHE